MVSSSDLPHLVNESPPTNLSNSEYSKTPERKNLLARCFDRASSPAPFYQRECEDYMNSTTTIDDNENGHDDSELFS
jgi:hypothetical protein